MLILNIETVPSEKVEEYFGIVDTQIVIGVNIFRDIFAGFRDLFGGQTKSYQKELDNLKQIAYDTISKKAKNVGANAVIGVKFDLEELSGQGKSMFMLSMQGTAVKMKEDFFKSKEGQKFDSLSVDNDELTKKIVLYGEMVKALSNEKPYFVLSNRIEYFTNESFWNKKLAKRLLDDCMGGFIHSNNLQSAFLEACKLTPNDLLIDYLEKNLETIKVQDLEHFKRVFIIKNIYSSKQLITNLKHNNYKVRYKALLLSYPILSVYQKSDIIEFEQVLECLENDFVTLEDELRDKQEELYECLNCGTKRKTSNSCSSCGLAFESGMKKFKNGNLEHEISVEALINYLKVTINTLKYLFNN